MEREPDGALRFRRPDGRPLPEVPPPPAVPAEPVEALRASNWTRDLRPQAWTGCAQWLGERLDLGWAIDVLHPLATRETLPPAARVATFAIARPPAGPR